MTAIAEALAHTPLWVWPLFAIVLFFGARNLWPRERPLAPLFILPAILLAFTLYNLTASSADLTLVILAFARQLRDRHRRSAGIWCRGRRRRFKGPGSRARARQRRAAALVVIAVIVLRYVVGYTYGRWPELRANSALAVESSTPRRALLAGVKLSRGRILRLAQISRRTI